MSGITIEDSLNEQSHEKLNNETATEQPKSSFDFLEFLKTPTGSGSVESYIDHSVNFNNSRGVARVLRGLSGFLKSDLNFAVVDVVVGLVEVFTSKKVKPDAGISVS